MPQTSFIDRILTLSFQIGQFKIQFPDVSNIINRPFDPLFIPQPAFGYLHYLKTPQGTIGLGTGGYYQNCAGTAFGIRNWVNWPYVRGGFSAMAKHLT
ncbi:MAG: hypothetical protein Tsb009_37560 [Planctomycetaceae bacterium]